jgi:hypothetical protein
MQNIKMGVVKFNSSRNVCIAFLLCGASALLGYKSPFQEGTVVRENKVKAAFLYNFTQFVEWPAEVFSDEQAPFVIGIVGKDSIGGFLSQIVQDEHVNGRSIVLRFYETVIPEVRNSQILFVQKSFGSIEELMKTVAGKPVLTISDHKDFMRMGGMLRFYVEDGRVRFEINRRAASEAKLVLSPKLLKLATIYKK